MNNYDPYKARKKRITAATVLFLAGLLFFIALIVIGFLLAERYPALVYAACGCALVYIIASSVILLGVSRRIDEPEEEKEEELPPYEIRHPLFRRISEQFDADGLAEFVNYVSLRGWKLGYVERRDDSIEFIFIRKERQVGVVLNDGSAEVTVDLQSDFPQDTVLNMDDYSEPVELWNGIISAGRDAAREEPSE